MLMWVIDLISHWTNSIMLPPSENFNTLKTAIDIVMLTLAYSVYEHKENKDMYLFYWQKGSDN